MVPVIAYTLICLYACLSGIKDAILYCKKGHDAFRWNEHIVFASERGVVISLLVCGYFLNKPYQLVNIPIAGILAFSFWHNGFYFETRKRIDVPGYNFASVSLNRSNWLEIPFIPRLIMMLISLFMIF